MCYPPACMFLFMRYYYFNEEETVQRTVLQMFILGKTSHVFIWEPSSTHVQIIFGEYRNICQKFHEQYFNQVHFAGSHESFYV